MKYEQEAMEKKGMEEAIKELRSMLQNMESDWATCARTGKSPCFFCALDETCECTNDADCQFKWQPHN